jgi:hypothetical protein
MNLPKRDERAEMCQEYFKVLIAALKHVAYRHGFALCVHGSLRRDIDLVAVPWRDTAVGGAHLADEIRKAAEIIIGIARQRECDPPTQKPCGRLAWSFYLTHADDGPYIDLSIMPVHKP